MTDKEQGFELRLFCECTQTTESKLKFSIAGMLKGRGDTGTLEQTNQQPPYILTMSIPKNLTSTTSRKKRSTDSRDTCSA